MKRNIPRSIQIGKGKMLKKQFIENKIWNILEIQLIPLQHLLLANLKITFQKFRY